MAASAALMGMKRGGDRGGRPIPDEKVTSEPK